MSLNKLLPSLIYIHLLRIGFLASHSRHRQFMEELLHFLIDKQAFHLLVGIFLGMLLHVKEHHPLFFFTHVCHCLAHLNCFLIQSIAFER